MEASVSKVLLAHPKHGAMLRTNDWPKEQKDKRWRERERQRDRETEMERKRYREREGGCGRVCVCVKQIVNTNAEKLPQSVMQ